MSESELTHIEKSALSESLEVVSLVAEVRRLQALVKHAERSGTCCGCDLCPWCGSEMNEAKHAERCSAFTPEGEVR